MEGSRIQPKREASPEVYLSSELFGFARVLQIGDKGEMEIHGAVSSESKDEDDNITRRFRIIQAKLKQEARIA